MLEGRSTMRRRADRRLLNSNPTPPRKPKMIQVMDTSYWKENNESTRFQQFRDWQSGCSAWRTLVMRHPARLNSPKVRLNHVNFGNVAELSIPYLLLGPTSGMSGTRPVQRKAAASSQLSTKVQPLTEKPMYSADNGTVERI